MQLKNGVDIVAINRIEKVMQHETFLERFFSPEERRYFLERGTHPQTVAGHFAAKEAFAKLLGTGITGFELREIGVAHDDLGCPFYRLSGRAAELAGQAQVSLSISHDGEYAIAFACALMP